MTVKTRLAIEVGTRAYLRCYAGDAQCPNPNRHEGKSGGLLTYHDASLHLMDSDLCSDWKLGGDPDDYDDHRWPQRCAGCGMTFSELEPKLVNRQIFRERRYNTPDGRLHPGDLFRGEWTHWEQPITGATRNGRKIEWKVPTTCVHGWSNCDGRHLFAVLPTGEHWDIDGRANNCTMPEDQEHRCWVRTGELPKITVGKGGHTCQAGAGSIATARYHGFLRDGEFVTC